MYTIQLVIYEFVLVLSLSNCVSLQKLYQSLAHTERQQADADYKKQLEKKYATEEMMREVTAQKVCLFKIHLSLWMLFFAHFYSYW